MKNVLSFGTDCQSMYFMSTRLLKYNIYGVRVPPFQLGYIFDTTHTLHKKIVKFFCGVNYIWWGNQELELKWW